MIECIGGIETTTTTKIAIPERAKIKKNKGILTYRLGLAPIEINIKLGDCLSRTDTRRGGGGREK
jgi:hypothetical protein